MPVRILFALVLVVAACATGCRIPPNSLVPPEPSPPAVEARIAALLQEHPLVDGHNDLVVHFLYCGPDCPRGPEGYDLARRTAGDTDIPRWRQGGVGGQLLNAGWLSDEVGLEGTLKGFRLVRELVARHPGQLGLARSAAELRQRHAEGRIGIVLALEHPARLGEDEATVARLADEGLRANILAYDDATPLADGHAGAAVHGGLSPLGVRMVGWMERHGILVDLSHASAETARDVLAIAQVPVVFSHSNAAALADVPRNVPDDVLERLPSNGGVVMVSFAPYFTSEAFAAWMARGDAFWEEALVRAGGDRAKAGPAMAEWEATHPPPAVGIAAVADHIDHVRKVAGVDHVGLGADFDGIAFKVTGLEDVATYPRLLAELAARGWSDEELAKLAGGNFLRVLAAADARRAAKPTPTPTPTPRPAPKAAAPSSPAG